MRAGMLGQRPYTVVMIVPTGIGATIGGYAGDALPAARAIAQVADCLITHPNVLNGAQLYWSLPNTLYVEGYGLDQFAAGNWGLAPVHQNRVGLVFDQGVEPELRSRHLQAADAARATLGLTLTDYVITDCPLEVTLQTAISGATWGTIRHPDSLLRAVEIAITTAGAEAIAVVARFPDDPDSLALQHYRHGQGADPLAGAEAVISHLVVRHFAIPCAHAPALLPLPLDPHVSPRAAAEELGYTFLPCVLVGLSRAPQFVRKISKSHTQANSGTERYEPRHSAFGSLWASDVDAVVVPADACGGSAVLSLSQTAAKVVAVGENKTRMRVPPEALGIRAIRVESYLDAVGLLVCDRAGINPEALHPGMAPIQSINHPRH